MRATNHSTQVFSPFGSGYVREQHGDSAPAAEPFGKPFTALLIVAGIALVSMLYLV